ncbi:hypothetical protein JCM11491_001799 [Sporobolomyces phaffii]
MRVKRWLTPPPSRPPEPQLARVRPVALARPPPPVPPSIISARRHALEAAALNRAPRDRDRVLGGVLARLPAISSRSRPREVDLAPWRHACAVAHAHLAAAGGPLAASRRTQFRNSVVRVVGHTMRLLLARGHVDAARELDRAFFTGRPRRRREPPTPTTPPTPTPTPPQNRYALGHGLALDRGHIAIAWMQSLAVRLTDRRHPRGDGGGAYDATARELETLLVGMRDAQARHGLNSSILAFAVRKLEVLHHRLAGAGLAKKGARNQVRQVLDSIKNADLNGDEVVSLALLDGAVEKLERQASRGEVDLALYGQVERELETLIGSLDRPPGEDLRALTELHERLPDSESIDRHSHILYLAIRFLLFRARHSAARPSESTLPASFTPAHALDSASQLYALLLDLSPAASRGAPLDLSRVRQRQSAALYRLLWAHLGIVDPDRAPAPSLARSNARPHSAVVAAAEERRGPTGVRPDVDLIEAAYDLIDSTLASTASLPRRRVSPLPPRTPPKNFAPSTSCGEDDDPRLVGVSTRFHRHALYLLSLPCAPSRRRRRGAPAEGRPDDDVEANPPQPRAPRPSSVSRSRQTASSSSPHDDNDVEGSVQGRRRPVEWSTFQRAFDVIKRQRLHDASTTMTTGPRHDDAARQHAHNEGGGGGGRTARAPRREWERDLVVHPAFAIHLLRATLLGAQTGSDPGGHGSSNGRGQEGGGVGTPLTRVGELFDVVETLERTGDAISGTASATERKARRLFRRAADVVVEDEWRGEGAREWKDLVKTKVRQWADARSASSGPSRFDS